MKDLVDKESDYSKKIELIKTPLLNFISSKIYNYEDAKDVLQNTLLILIKKQNCYDANKSFYSWSFTICRFQIKRFFTESKRNKEDCYESLEDIEGSPSKNHSPVISLINKELNQKKDLEVNDVIKNLMSERERWFYSLTKKGESRASIMSLMNIKTINYYAYRRRISQKFIKSGFKFEQCQEN